MRRIIISIFTLGTSLTAFAQQNDVPKLGDESNSPEELIITGERHQWDLRLEMEQAQREAYDLFNSLNDEERFDVSCGMYQPTGSRIRFQLCQPEFQISAYKAAGQDFQDSYRSFQIRIISTTLL